MAKTFKQKVAELEEKRRADLEKNKNFEDKSIVKEPRSESQQTTSSEKIDIKRFPSNIQTQTLAIFVSLFVIILAYLYATDSITFPIQGSQASLDKSFVYKGGLANGTFSGSGVVTDNAGNKLTAKFKSGKIAGTVKYQKKDSYTVLQTTAKNSTIKLQDKTVVDKSGDLFTTKSANFSYTGSWRFAGSWQGNLNFSNKASYSGDWKNGLPNGQGSYTTILGESINGKFKFGVPQNEN